MQNITDRFVDYLINKSQSTNQSQSKQQAKRCVLDYLGVVFAGKKLLGEKGERLAGQFPYVEKGSSVIGFSVKKSPDTAAFLNGFISHVAELDDGVNSGIVHPGTPILSAMFALAQVRNISGEDFLKGVIMGYEATIRLANAVQPSHKKRGYHATGTCGAVGAAVALAVMCNVSRNILKNAISATLISAGGSLKALEDNSELKPFNVGNAAKAGLLAFLTAEAGFQGPEDSLGGSIGFLEMKADSFDVQKLMPVASDFAINSIYIKPYAACRYSHPAIEAAIKMAKKRKLFHANVESILVSTYELAVKNHDHTQVSGMSSAKMSIPYSVATSIVNGGAGINEFLDVTVSDRAVQSLTKRVKVSANPFYTNSFPEKSYAEVIICLTDGTQFSEIVAYPKGEPENPLSDHELEEKFKELSLFAGLNISKADEVIHATWNLGNDIKALYLLF